MEVWDAFSHRFRPNFFGGTMFWGPPGGAEALASYLRLSSAGCATAAWAGP